MSEQVITPFGDYYVHSTPTDPPTVLVADDERQLADLYTTWLDREYDVRTAYNSADALLQFDGSVDVVLLDRRMPEMSGDELLSYMRDSDVDCQIAMVSAVEPDFDVFDLGFDDYLVKPVDRPELLGLVERLLQRRTFDRKLRRHFALASKRALLETHLTEAELAASDEYDDLLVELADLDEDIDRGTREMNPDEVAALLRQSA